uniref:Uncharacterized protein n=1 Tax=Salmonella sp. TaxID=599 RepID=A0A482EW78_SALSP|nr:hypothetical protein NNIBIDOC_00213 [Salmonella sp.]
MRVIPASNGRKKDGIGDAHRLSFIGIDEQTRKFRLTIPVIYLGSN